MPTVLDYKGIQTTWCPGCGNFAILNGLKQALVNLGLAPHEVVVFSGIGQAAKLPLYMKCHALNGLHGRVLPLATGACFANHTLKAIAVGGDGDGFAEGGNHFLHAVRRNPDLAYFMHDNQVYGLTKGQASPTSDPGFVTATTPKGMIHERLSPLALAVALNVSFAARTHTGALEHMVNMMQLAIGHKGFAFLEIMQPCVTYNKVNTRQWYQEQAYDIGSEKDYDPLDRQAAFQRSLEWGDRFPIGVIYRSPRPAMADKLEVLKEKPLVAQPDGVRDIAPLLESFR